MTDERLSRYVRLAEQVAHHRDSLLDLLAELHAEDLEARAAGRERTRLMAEIEHIVAPLDRVQPGEIRNVLALSKPQAGQRLAAAAQRIRRARGVEPNPESEGPCAE